MNTKALAIIALSVACSYYLQLYLSTVSHKTIWCHDSYPSSALVHSFVAENWCSGK